MILLQTLAELHTWRATNSGPIVLVPTMGALHEGHLNLMREAREIAGATGKVIVSIFVNPLQFGPKEDFSKYPRELEDDAEKCESVAVDAIFAPSADEMYVENRSVIVLETKLSQLLCGTSRPGHFDGVCTVVLKLFNLVQPDIAIFGKKDYQQLAIIKRMVRDLNLSVEIIGSETVRESDGLAMSSRNRYLDSESREQAAVIREGLLLAREAWQKGEQSAEALCQIVQQHLKDKAPLHRLDYMECVNRESLESVSAAYDDSLLACAVYFGTTRLIDNLELAW